MMRSIFPTLSGNEKIKMNVGLDISMGMNSHAYIIEGPAGSGKKTLARLIAAAASCDNRFSERDALPCGRCNNCSRIMNDISADVVWITPGDKASIGVEAVREIRQGLYVTPNDSDFRTYIITNAEKMTVQAQNALLLSLEEPPSFVIFLLLTEDSAKLLETIRSRAQTLRVELFDAPSTEKYILENVLAVSKERLDAAVSLSGGALGSAFELASGSAETSGLIKSRAYAEKLVSLLISGKKNELLTEISQNMPKNYEEAKDILYLTSRAIRDVYAVKKAGAQSLIFFASADEAQKLSSVVSTRKLLKIHDNIEDAVTKLASNVSVKVAMMSLALAD